jgi:ABC-type glycerol-3-phosphate transport system permease component
MFIPFFWMLTSSFKPFSEISALPMTLFPKRWTIENFLKLGEKINLFRTYGNSLFLAVIKTFIILYTSSVVAYVISKIPFRFNKILFMFILATMMIPWPVIIIPLYQEMSWFKWVGKYTSIIIPSAFSSFGIFMMKQFIDEIPNELMEASRCDGASEWTIFHRVVVPNAVPAFSALAIFQFLWVWDDLLWPYLMINKTNKFTLPLLLMSFQGWFFNNYGPIIAGATVSVVPVIIVYIIFQSRFVEGIAMTGIRG